MADAATVDDCGVPGARGELSCLEELRGSLNRAALSEVWAIAWPAIAHMFLVTLVFLVSRAMVGRYSSEALASLQISTTLTWTIYSVFTASAVGTLAVVARSVGANDFDAAARASRASMRFAFAVGLVVVAPIFLETDPLLRVLFPKAAASVRADAAVYLRYVLPAIPLAFVEASAAAALQGAGDTKTPLRVAAIGNVINVALGWVLIFGRFGMPELGVRGAAIGAAATMAIEGALLTVAIARSKGALAAPRGARNGELGRVLRVSVPAFAERVVYHSGYLGFVAIIGLLGATAMAANQALLSLEAVVFLSADGFAIAAGALVAQKLGASKPAEASRAGWSAAAIATAFALSCSMIFALVPAALMRAFTPDASIVAAGTRALYVAAIAEPFMAFATVMAMSVRGAGATKTALLATIVCALVVRVVATYLFAIVLELGLVGVWIGSTCDWAARSLVLGAAYARGRWRTARV